MAGTMRMGAPLREFRGANQVDTRVEGVLYLIWEAMGEQETEWLNGCITGGTISY